MGDSMYTRGRVTLALASSMLLIGCCLADRKAVADANNPTTLQDVVKYETSQRPTTSNYVKVAVRPDGAAPIPKDSCVDRGFWAFTRKFFGKKSEASAILTARITPSAFPNDQPLVIPIFITSASEISSDGTGSKCLSQFLDRDISFTYGTNSKPEFDIDLEFHFIDKTKSEIAKKALEYATTLVDLIGTASGTPAALANPLANPKIAELSAALDTSLSDHWSMSNDLILKTHFDGRLGATTADAIVFKMRSVTADGGGPATGKWSAGGKIYLKYEGEKLKEGTRWLSPDQVMSLQIVPVSTSGAQRTLADLITNGTVTGGFNQATLDSQSTAE